MKRKTKAGGLDIMADHSEFYGHHSSAAVEAARAVDCTKLCNLITKIRPQVQI